jgi:hypothetical protein
MLGWMKSHRIITIAAVVVALALVGAVPALASQTITGGDVVIDEDVNDDLYVTGQNITVNATIDGDLIAFGQTVTINGTVTGDALVGGQVVELNGAVEDDARMAGMIVKLYDGATVGDDLNAAGWAVDMEPGSSVGGTMYAAGSQVRVADVGEDFGGGAEGIRIAGTVGGDAEASVGDGSTPSFFNPSMATMGQDIELPAVPTIPSGLTFAEGGTVEGNLNYTSAAEQSIPASAVGGAVAFTLEQPSQPEAQAAARSGVAKFAGRFLGTGVMLLLVGLLVTVVAPAFLEDTLDTIRKRPLASFGVGVAGYVALIGILIVLIIVGVLLIIPLGAVGAAGRFIGLLLTAGTGVTLAFNILVRWVAPIAIALLVGRAIYRLFDRERVAPIFWPLLIGGFGVALLLAIPILGRLLGAFLIGAIGLGAAVLTLWPRRNGGEPVAGRRPEPPTGSRAAVMPAGEVAEPSSGEPVGDEPAG